MNSIRLGVKIVSGLINLKDFLLKNFKMKKITILLFTLSLLTQLDAQTKAVTEDGEEVILYDDGTWKPLNDSTDENLDKIIPTNPTSFIKPKESTFQLKSKKVNFGFSFNPNKWKINQNKYNAAAEYELVFKEGDIYAMYIVEQIEIPIEKLKSIAFGRVKKVAPDAAIVKEEYRTVNGNKILMLQFNATVQSMKFTYFVYYYSCPDGVVQIMCYTGQSLFATYEKICENLLNGLEDLK